MNNKIDNVLVIKVGTSTLTKKDDSGKLRLDVASFNRIGEQVVDLQNKGYAVAIVSSAAITAGMVATGTLVRPTNTESSMPTLQALASIGWRYVLNAWADALGRLTVGELLITKQELERDSEASELLRVTHNLMVNKAVAIINENDAITHEEIAFGDNDTLAAYFATKLKSSDLFGDNVYVVMLSDIDGVYKDIHDSSSVIRRIDTISEHEAIAKSHTSEGGTGGMVTKFKAAKIAQDNGIKSYITNGRADNAIYMALENQAGTYFSV